MNAPRSFFTVINLAFRKRFMLLGALLRIFSNYLSLVKNGCR